MVEGDERGENPPEMDKNEEGEHCLLRYSFIIQSSLIYFKNMSIQKLTSKSIYDKDVSNKSLIPLHTKRHNLCILPIDEE